MLACPHARMLACLLACLLARTHARTHARMHACMHACMLTLFFSYFSLSLSLILSGSVSVLLCSPSTYVSLGLCLHYSLCSFLFSLSPFLPQLHLHLSSIFLVSTSMRLAVPLRCEPRPQPAVIVCQCHLFLAGTFYLVCRGCSVVLDSRRDAEGDPVQNLDLGSYNSTVKRYLGFFMSSLRGLMCDEGGANIIYHP